MCVVREKSAANIAASGGSEKPNENNHPSLVDRSGVEPGPAHVTCLMLHRTGPRLHSLRYGVSLSCSGLKRRKRAVICPRPCYINPKFAQFIMACSWASAPSTASRINVM
jgi:hypothetical protein